MTISSRTPEGLPARCPLCGAATNLEFTEPTGDAPCPNCGHLLWFSAQLLETLQRQWGESLGATPGGIEVDTALAELGADSLDTVELVMELEEEFGLPIPDDVAQRMKTIGDMIRYIQQQRRKRG